MMTRWDADRRDIGAARAAVFMVILYATVMGLVVVIGALFHNHPVPTLIGATAVVSLYSWLFRDRNDTDTHDDTTEDPS